MAEIRVEYSTSCSRKCAFPSSKIVNLEFGDESPDGSSESAFTTFFCNDRISQYGNNLIHKSNDEIDKDFLIHSQLSLSHDIHNANRQPSTTDCEIDKGLFELLSSSKSAKISVPHLEKNSSNKNNSDESAEMKNLNKVGEDLSDVLTSVSIRDKNLAKSANDSSSGKNDFLDDFHITDLNFSKNECKNSEPRKPPENAFFKKGESLSDLLSSLDVKDSNTHRFSKSDIDVHNIKKLDDNECNANFSLSDILCSINVEKENISKPITCNSLLENSEEVNLSLKDFYYSSDSPQGLILDAKSSSPNDSCASSYSDTKDASNNSIAIKNSFLNDETNDSDSGISSFGSLKQEFSFFNSSPETMDSFNTLLEHMDETKNGNVYEDQKIKNNNEGMSMFDLMSCVNEVKDIKNSKMDHSKLTNESEHCMSMLDFVKSIDLKSDTLFADASNSKCFVNGSSCNMPLTMNCKNTHKKMDCLEMDAFNVKHSVLRTQNNLLEEEKNVSDEDDTEQITCIDLRACIKSTKNSSSCEVRKNESFECISPEKLGTQSYDCIINFDDGNNNSLFLHPPSNNSDTIHLIETSPSKKPKVNSLFLHPSSNNSDTIHLIETSPSKKPKVNSKQSLFSMALGCKPKKNHLLAQKIAGIKFKLYENFINRPTHFENNAQPPNTEPGLPLNHNVQSSDQCIISYAGRKSFGMEVSCELQ
ncbi:uncharacterized protein TNIN_208251 [Trichonephila inaurata madagascariensis]|uniref:Uncharacterized protein n=1 Tax=Trichonephila inaurata madagascariensis TaxID=2747483 RepID=A0A8X6YWE4_9ARAC|nr:uncharacterized protein TNIN_208251 [Trichonephila inaurata madagascariensis]